MKKCINRYAILFILCLIFLFSCMNRYDKKAVGDYEVGDYKRIDTLSKSLIDLPHLSLKNNKTYSLTFKDSQLKGKWKAVDYDDFIVIEFTEIGKEDLPPIQAKLIGLNSESIDMANPSDFNCPQLKTLIFKKKDKK